MKKFKSLIVIILCMLLLVGCKPKEIPDQIDYLPGYSSKEGITIKKVNNIDEPSVLESIEDELDNETSTDNKTSSMIDDSNTIRIQSMRQMILCYSLEKNIQKLLSYNVEKQYLIINV